MTESKLVKGRRPKNISPQLRAKIESEIKEGYTYHSIGEENGVARITVARIAQKMKAREEQEEQE